MWRAPFAAICFATLCAACLGGGGESPLPTFSPSYWASQVCRSPGSIDLVLLDPQADPRFVSDPTATIDGDPQEVVAGRIDLNLRNLRNLADYLESQRRPEVATEFHQALIDGARTLADAVQGVREEILEVQSLDEARMIYDELMAIDDQRLENLEQTALDTLTPNLIDQIDERPGCWEHLGIGPLVVSS